MQNKSSHSEKRQIEVSTTRIEYVDHIVYLRLKEDADFTYEATLEQHAAQDTLTQQDDYAVLVDARKHISISKESREFMANYMNPRRKATAILTDRSAPMLIMANFYMKVNRPKLPTKLFNSEEEAVVWLKDRLK